MDDRDARLREFRDHFAQHVNALATKVANPDGAAMFLAQVDQLAKLRSNLVLVADVVKEEVRRRMSQETVSAQTKGLVERLREEYLVEIHEDLLDAAIAGLANS